MNFQDLSEAHKHLISKVAKENGLRNIEVKVENGSKKGDNYVGLITSIKITEKAGGKSMDLILKHAKDTDAFRQDNQVSRVFIREAKMYNEVLPILLKFQKDANISNPFLGVAECYGITLDPNRECILMENLKSKGYKMWNRRKPIDHDHVVLVFSEYAKFHAISFALKDTHPYKFEKLTKDLTSVMGTPEERIKLFDSYRQTALKCVKSQVLLKALESGWKNIESHYVDLRSEKFVIQHGDAWCNNMLFKYKENGSSTPSQLYLVDWQNSKIGSPVWDLLYFLCVCGSSEVLFNHQRYIKIYYEVLSKNLKEFGCDLDKVFTFETLKNQWKKYAKMGLFCMLMVGQILVAEESDIPVNFDELSRDKTKTLNDILHLCKERQEMYNQRLSDLIEFLVKENLL